MVDLDWGGFGTSLVACKLISQRKPVALTLRGDPARALRRVATPGATFDRALLNELAGQIALATLPGLMLLALGLGYAIRYENLPGEALRILFDRAPAGGTSAGADAEAGPGPGGGAGR